MKFLLDTLKGIAIGSGAILPGISSGVFCVIFGLYEKLIDSILNFFNDVKTNLKFLFPLVIGAGIGIVLFGNLLNYSLYQFPIQTKSIFIGLILGSIPALLKEINKKQTFKPCYWFFFLFALIIGISCIFGENIVAIQTLENASFLYLVLGGFLMSIGIVVPGVSSTIILMLLGIYPIYLSSVSTLHFPVLIPILIGVIIGGFCFLKLTNFLLTRFYGPTFYCIIGFTVGSIFVLLPTFSSSLDVIIGILSCILRFYCCFFTRKPTLNYKKTFFVICINFHIKGKGEMS
ncbi:MAG: DUF368 domain-containing protein [Clostridia bacterium]|nr:DUF368 domain-containing protein [Clostridia bacterium]